MGITQNANGTANVQQLAKLLLLRGNMGKPGAGICPLRGHSNVQGERTVGITEITKEDMLAQPDARFGLSSPRAHANIGRESCGERVWQNMELSWADASLKKKT